MPGHIIWLHERLRGAEHASLRRALSVYVNRVVVPRVAPDASLPEPADLPETAAMRAETVDAWARKLMKKGRREGRMEGRSDGLRQALLTVLERRFGAVPAGARARIEAAPAESLEAWLVNVLEARSLDEVFGKG